MKPKLLFLTLNTFSATGGIEKVCRVAAKALNEIAEESGAEIRVYSLHDEGRQANEAYLAGARFKGFAGRQIQFALAALQEGRKADTVLLSHSNLLPVGYLIKKISPKTKLVLMAHGIEVWDERSGWKKKMLWAVDLFLPVSTYTAGKLQTVHGLQAQKIRVLNNCLDPYLSKEKDPALLETLRRRYNLLPGNRLLLTVTRLKFSEQYKGYDKVVESLHAVNASVPGIKYLIVGKYDAEEKARLDAIVKAYGLEDAVIFSGFVKDEELAAHFQLADVYVMPSTGEGFGIVFIEALFYGLPVIAGNADGSADALAGGSFGLLVNPHKTEEIAAAIKQAIVNKADHIPAHNRVIERFGFEAYKENLSQLLGFKMPKPFSAKRAQRPALNEKKN